MEEDTAGDPVTGEKWCRRTLEKISQQLYAFDIYVSPNTVAKVLKQLGYKLRVNHKKLARKQDPLREEQFEYIFAQREAFVAAGQPVVSVDTKHRELIGLFHRAGRTWRTTPILVNDHDFPSDAEGVAIPYGVYDLFHNFGSVSVGTSKDTPEFAVASLARWWRYNGRFQWPNATELLVLADGGGSNGYRVRAWKHWLQHNLVNRYGLTVTVCHFPTSTSKWNPIEHRLFSEISKNWAGQPLTSHELAVKYISTTTTVTGLTVKAYLDERTYQTTTVTNEEMAALTLQPHDTQPSRNYTISPQ